MSIYTTITISILNDVAVIALWLLVRQFLGSYMTEKAKNLATKADVGEITKKVEEVRSQFEAQNDIRRAELNQRVDIHRLKFEWEFSVLRTLWAKISDDILKEANWLRLASSQRPGSDPEKAQEKLSKFAAVLAECEQVNELNRPFVDEKVYAAVRSLLQLSSELYSKALTSPSALPPDVYWIQTEQDRQKVLSSVNHICDTIRERVSPTFAKG